MGLSLKSIGKAITGSVGFFTGGASGASLATGGGVTKQTVALDLAGLTAGQSLAGAALPGAAAITAGATKVAGYLPGAGSAPPVDGHNFGGSVPLDFGDNAAGPGAPVQPQADKTPASPPLMAPQSPLLAWLVLGGVLLFVLKG